MFLLGLSPILLRRNTSSRLLVVMKSAAMTGSKIITHKSATKKDVKLTFHKYDPIVGRHVIYYETRLPKHIPINKQKRLWRNRYIRFTGRGIKPLIELVRSQYNEGHYNKYFNRYFYQLVDRSGRSFPFY